MNPRPRILIIDDERATREGLAALLAAEEYDIRFARDGLEGIAMARTVHPDTVLLDVMMPRLDGFEVCRALRDEPELRHVPVILLTALTDRDYLARGLDAGADEFVSKPTTGLELRARVRSMLRIKRQYDELQRLLTLREDLVRMVVHDMRSPIIVSQWYIDRLAQDASLGEPQHHAVSRIRSVADRLLRFTDEILLIAKMEEGSLRLHRSKVKAHDLVDRAVDAHREEATAKRIGLALLPEKGDGEVSLDPELMARVLDNLIGNAIKFAPPGSGVTIRVTFLTGDRQLRIEVLDEGAGIPEGQRQAIFQKYTTLEQSAHSISQIGLGLTFCKMVVEAHGGRIGVASNAPRGSVFSVEI